MTSQKNFCRKKKAKKERKHCIIMSSSSSSSRTTPTTTFVASSDVSSVVSSSLAGLASFGPHQLHHRLEKNVVVSTPLKKIWSTTKTQTKGRRRLRRWQWSRTGHVWIYRSRVFIRRGVRRRLRESIRRANRKRDRCGFGRERRYRRHFVGRHELHRRYENLTQKTDSKSDSFDSKNRLLSAHCMSTYVLKMTTHFLSLCFLRYVPTFYSSSSSSSSS